MLSQQPTRSAPRRLCLMLACLWVAVGCGGEEGDNHAPMFTEAPETAMATVGVPLRLTFRADDPDGDRVTLRLADGPESANFTSSESGVGELHWAPLASDTEPGGRDHDLTIAAEDGNGGSVTHALRVRVLPSGGTPEFTTSNERILDLSRSDTLEARISIKDDDSLEVVLTLTEGPDNMILDQDDPKSALLRWTPTPEQIDEKLVWTAVINADDRTGGVAEQRISVILIGVEQPMGTCEGVGISPTITHEPLGDQNGPNDYLIEVTITEKDSQVVEPTLFWTVGDPDDTGSYQSRPLIDQGDRRYATNLPNPVRDGDQPVTVSYLLCASDDDDPNGDTCDHVRCVPDSGAFQFVATPPTVTTTCDDDRFEPNNSASAATTVETPGAQSVEGLTLCGDDDFFSLDMFAGDHLRVAVAPNTGTQPPRVRLLDLDGETVVGDSSTETPIHYTALDFGFYYVRVSSPSQGSYRLTVDVCENGFDEPNDTPELASPLLSDEVTEGNILCPGERDLYRISAPAGALIEAVVEVTSPGAASIDGELTFRLFAPDGVQLLAEGLGDGSEALLSREVIEEGDYLLAVDSLRDTGEATIFSMLVVVE